jgi:cytochrome c-type biogenesis protein CcmH/NrfG
MIFEALLLSFLIVAMVVFAVVSFLSWKIYINQKIKDDILRRMEQKLDSILNEDEIVDEINPPEHPKEKENEW